MLFVGRYAGTGFTWQMEASSTICIGPHCRKETLAGSSALSIVNIGVYAGYGANGGNWIGDRQFCGIRFDWRQEYIYGLSSRIQLRW